MAWCRSSVSRLSTVVMSASLSDSAVRSRRPAQQGSRSPAPGTLDHLGAHCRRLASAAFSMRVRGRAGQSPESPDQQSYVLLRSPIDDDDLVQVRSRWYPRVELRVDGRQLVAVAGDRRRHLEVRTGDDLL